MIHSLSYTLYLSYVDLLYCHLKPLIPHNKYLQVCPQQHLLHDRDVCVGQGYTWIKQAHVININKL